jgi:shikimate dehydrogenase
MSLLCAVIGLPIEHSLSPYIHQAFAKQTHLSLSYEKIQGDESLFEEQVRVFFARQGMGLNVTQPFKQRAYAMADVCSERCRKAGAANTLWYRDNQLYADNTDGIGLIRDLTRHIQLHQAKILILGAGGAARGIIHPLLDMQPERLVVANRSIEPLKQLQADIPQITAIPLSDLKGHFDLIINATSAGLSGECITLPEDLIRQSPFCYDLSYQKNGVTPFVQYTQQLGCKAFDGWGMLVEQAAESFYLWHGVKAEARVLERP